jgi:hypothetical protein
MVFADVLIDAAANNFTERTAFFVYLKLPGWLGTTLQRFVFDGNRDWHTKNLPVIAFSHLEEQNLLNDN